MPSMRKAKARHKEGCSEIDPYCGGEEGPHVHYKCPICKRKWWTPTYEEWVGWQEAEIPPEAALSNTSERKTQDARPRDHGPQREITGPSEPWEEVLAKREAEKEKTATETVIETVPVPVVPTS